MKKQRNTRTKGHGKKVGLVSYKGKNILITGGLGFLGSNLACELVKLGAHVTILDSLHPRYGGNLFNIEECKRKIKVIIGDTRDRDIVRQAVKNKDIIFNFAAQVSYIDSPLIPHEDLDVNCRGHLNILESIKENDSKPRVIFSSSRLVIGINNVNPVNENHPTNPLSLYGIHKLAGEKYHNIYWKLHKIPTIILRITNPFGKKQQIKHNKYSLPGWFMRQAMEGKEITIFGDGKQVRDYIYVSDIVDAFLHIGMAKGVEGEIFNLGYGKSYRFKDMVEAIVKEVGRGKIRYIPWPDNYEKIETGHFEIDISKIKKATGWKPTTTLKEGITDMVSYYKKHKNRYIDDN